MKTLFKVMTFLLIFLISSFQYVDNNFSNTEYIHTEKPSYNDSILPLEMKMVPVDLQDVKLSGPIGDRVNTTINNNLLRLDIKNDFLAPFQKKEKHEGFIGIGNLIDASVKLAYYSKRPEVENLKQSLIEELIKTQEKDGKIGTLVKDSRMWKLWDIHEMGYIIFGLVNDYRYFHAEESLTSAIKLANYLIQNWSGKIPKSWKLSDHLGMIGLDRAMLALYNQTEISQYKDFVINELHINEWNLDIVLGRKEKIEGHIYAYLTRCIAQLELYLLQPDKDLLRPTLRALRFMTQQEGMLVTGETGQWECWTNDQDGGAGLGETCATAYQMRLLGKLFEMDGNPVYSDMLCAMVTKTAFNEQKLIITQREQ